MENPNSWNDLQKSIADALYFQDLDPKENTLKVCELLNNFDAESTEKEILNIIVEYEKMMNSGFCGQSLVSKIYLTFIK